jgi:hypothetical protein
MLDLAIEVGLGVLDRVAPLPETPVDRVIREEGRRLRRLSVPRRAVIAAAAASPSRPLSVPSTSSMTSGGP